MKKELKWCPAEGRQPVVLLFIHYRKSKKKLRPLPQADPTFQLGKIVLLDKGNTKKFILRLIGPYQIYRRVSPTFYPVQDLPCNRKKRLWRHFNAHVSQIQRNSLRRETDWCPADSDEKKIGTNTTAKVRHPSNQREIRRRPTKTIPHRMIPRPPITLPRNS